MIKVHARNAIVTTDHKEVSIYDTRSMLYVFSK